MSYDPAKLKLVVHYWPLKPDGGRVPPNELRQYRETHEYLGPGCLCPLLEPRRKNTAYKEAAICLSIDGRYKGEYVAECAQGRCGYSVPLERVYLGGKIKGKSYPLRGVGMPYPSQVNTDKETRSVTKTQLKRTYAQADLMDSPLPAPGFEGVDLSRRTDWRKLTKLECIEKPGLTEEQFLGLFIKCDACGLITTHLLFYKHHCRPDTVDDSGSELSDKE
ncbi:hypothetical protein F5887DRAFT_1080196 [Amanita rubescens]|nr:hypothetical protein F5887DRAFT_1080196 [Amanita rubescens]